MNTTKAGPNEMRSGADAEFAPMMSAILQDGLSLRYISLRARKLPKIQRPSLIWLTDRRNGGRGPASFHQDFLNALFVTAGKVLVFPGGISKHQEQNAIGAALSTGCAVVVLTTPSCVEAWIHAAKTASQEEIGFSRHHSTTRRKAERKSDAA